MNSARLTQIATSSWCPCHARRVADSRSGLRLRIATWNRNTLLVLHPFQFGGGDVEPLRSSCVKRFGRLLDAPADSSRDDFCHGIYSSIGVMPLSAGDSAVALRLSSGCRNVAMEMARRDVIQTRVSAATERFRRMEVVARSNSVKCNETRGNVEYFRGDGGVDSRSGRWALVLACSLCEIL